jgi:hypothetical protein
MQEIAEAARALPEDERLELARRIVAEVLDGSSAGDKVACAVAGIGMCLSAKCAA